MQRQGVRRLLVLSGESQWCQQRAVEISGLFHGDWWWISRQAPQSSPTRAPEAAHQLLGQECLHGVFDAREGLNVEALAAFSGILRAGSWLIMLVPELAAWPALPDADSIRWSEQAEAIATPQFIHRFCQILQADPQAIVWQQGVQCQFSPLTTASAWSAPDGAPTDEQQTILHRLLQADSGIWVLTAARGRGKSTLAGMLVQHWEGPCWVTAPSKAAGEILSLQSEQGAQFWAPDALLAHCASGATLDADWLLIDEAAAIPTPLLVKLIAFFPRVLLTTTVQGYEGTGRGFVLKFCASLPQWHDLRLSLPVRWAQNCPLEAFIDEVLLFNEPDTPLEQSPNAAPLCFSQFTREAWSQHPERLAAFYTLLASAHYRTSPLDLRRLMDAPGLSFSIAQREERLAAALWLVDEGGLEPTLAHEVWAGRRRPRGNLVAQSLAAHGGFPDAAVMISRRITRIAVAVDSRRQGIASALIREQQQFADEQRLDFLSVSFGFTDELWRFWQRCGFEMVRVGGVRETSSGCYTAMAILPLSEQGRQLVGQASRQLFRNRQQLPSEVGQVLWCGSDDANTSCEPDSHALNEEDWRELAGFAFASRTLDGARSALLRLLAESTLALPMLRAVLQDGLSVAEVVSQFNINGKKAALQHWRSETQSALQQISPAQTESWKFFSG